nr:VanZ family protein [Nocardioides panaciterrulae]
MTDVLADEVWRYSPIGPIPTLIAGFVGLTLVVHVTWVRSARTQVITWALLAACILAILAVTGRGSLGNDGGGFSWRLGDSILSELHNVNRELGLLNVFGNVAMFVPVGWLAALLVRRRGFVVGALSAAGFSAAIEIWQSLSGSFGDIDDVVLNSVGGMIGASLAVSIQAASRHRSGRRNEVAAHHAGAGSG